MKRSLPWMQMVMLGTAVTFAVALAIAILGAAAGAASSKTGPSSVAAAEAAGPLPSPEPAKQQVSSDAPSSQLQIYEGMVTCSRCGAKHPASFGKSASDCVRACVHGGAQFALIDGDTVYVLDADADQMQQLKRVAGERASITGAMNGDKISVSAVNAGVPAAPAAGK